MAKRNPHTGSNFDAFLKEEGIYDQVQAKALKRALAEQLAESMEAAKLGKAEMARKMETSRSHPGARTRSGKRIGAARHAHQSCARCG